MIVGFDTDDQQIFEAQVRFLDEAGIPFTTSGVLFAIERTPLHDRLKREGRLIGLDLAIVQGHGAADLDFIPKLMTVPELLAGYNWMIRQHYRYDTYQVCSSPGSSTSRRAGTPRCGRRRGPISRCSRGASGGSRTTSQTRGEAPLLLPDHLGDRPHRSHAAEAGDGQLVSYRPQAPGQAPFPSLGESLLGSL
jgi:Domain of unknown function (DUF4070)